MGTVYLDGVEADISRGGGTAPEQLCDRLELVVLKRPAARLAEPVNARRADGHHAIGVVALHALVPQLCGDSPPLFVDGANDAFPPREHLVARERRDGVWVTRGRVGQPDSFGDDQPDAARGAPSVVLGDIGAGDTAR